MANKVKVTTPHAAVMIWNYRDRLGTETTTEDQVNAVEEVLISTASLISISTAKSKSEPTGRFQLVLAPNRNWISTITAGSWCCIMMSQKPITQADIDKANPEKVKFIGKIESVRMTTVADPETGAQQSAYRVIGVDWGHIFENHVYIDPFIDKNNNSVGAATYIELFNKAIGLDSRAEIKTTTENMTSILSIVGQPLSKDFQSAGQAINRVANVNFSFVMPTKMREFFEFSKRDNSIVRKDNVVEAIQMYTGKLESYDQYLDVKESSGFIDPASFKGMNTLWQLLIDNSNPVLNETFCDIRWNQNGRPTLALYNRIKPFAYRGNSLVDERLGQALEKETFGNNKNKKQIVEDIKSEVKNIMSKFQDVRTYEIPLEDVIDVEAGTNWRDKFNFIEIKPSWQIYDVLSSWVKTVAQTADERAFQREGFRPLIVSTKQFPSQGAKKDAKTPNSLWLNIDLLAGWKHLLREWFFDTHRLLNGTINIIGQNNYIQVGDNIKIKQEVLGMNKNMNSATGNQESYLLAHVENITHTFRVDQNGARTWVTTINFVRGIMVTNNGKLVGEGKLDGKSTDTKESQDLNRVNTVTTSSVADPGKRLRGK
jgi:hypothetical protein